MERMDIVIFGAGRVGYEAYRVCQKEGNKVKYYIDNNSRLWGSRTQNGIQIISLNKYIEDRMGEQILIAAQYRNQSAIEQQLRAAGLDNYRIFDLSGLYKYGRLTSYSSPRDIEDVILYHLFRDDDDIFYIDVGSNDPFSGSVTKLLYDCKNARGINIEPQPNLIKVTNAERPRDINICAGVGKEEKTEMLFLQGGGSTILDENSVMEKGETIKTDIVTLKHICEKYVPKGQKISFLKIDAEGFERSVLESADFTNFRPEILCIEATIPRTTLPCFEKWEDILVENGYGYLFSYGINRYYASNEKRKKFEKKAGDISKINEIYNIYHASLAFWYDF